MVVVLVIILPTIIFVTLIWAVLVLNKQVTSYIHRKSSIDFNKFIKYHDDKLYVDGIEEPNIAKIALAIQQRIGSEREDFHSFDQLIE